VEPKVEESAGKETDAETNVKGSEDNDPWEHRFIVNTHLKIICKQTEPRRHRYKMEG